MNFTEVHLSEMQSRRYATKTFDRNRSISAAAWQTLEESLRLSASSYNMQPWKFIVVTDDDVKIKLRDAAFNQSQVEDCSHYVIICARRTIDSSWIQRLIDRVHEVRGISQEALIGYSKTMNEDVLGRRKHKITEIISNQCYLALGTLLTSAAVLGIDSCAIEGFIPEKFDEILGLHGTDWTSCVSAAMGYRNPADKYATLPKVRFPKEEVFEYRGEI
ncbi:MAG: NAD(P)H-dependent oxidoreductase [Bdellovibrionota bacterium]